MAFRGLQEKEGCTAKPQTATAFTKYNRMRDLSV